MTGRITRLIDDQQFGTIAGEDGTDYLFHGRSLVDTPFATLHLGATVCFTPIAATRRAELIRLEAPKPTVPDAGRLP